MKSIGHRIPAAVLTWIFLLPLCPLAVATNAESMSATNVVVLNLPNPGTAGISRPTTNSSDDDLIDITLDDVPLNEVVRMFTRLSRRNIICNPEELRGNISLNLTGVKALPALDSVLNIHGMELLETAPGSQVYIIRRWRTEGVLSDLLFHEQGKAFPSNRIHVAVTNAPLPEVLLQIARQAKIDIRYETRLASHGNFTMDVADAEYIPLLEQIVELQGLRLKRTFNSNTYIVEAIGQKPPTYIAEANGQTSPTSTSQQAAPPYPTGLAAGLVASLAAILGLMFALPAVISRDAARFAETGKCRAWRPMVFWPFVLLLCVIYGWSIGTWLAWDTFFTSTGIEAGVVVSLATTALLFGLAILVVNIVRSIGWPRRRLQRVLSWAIALLPIAVIMMDSSPISDDYKRDDLPKPPGESSKSVEFLRELIVRQPTNLPSCIVQGDYVTNVLEYAGEIETAWINAAAARQLVTKLSSFDGLDDPTYYERMDVYSTNALPMVSIRNIGHIYRAYALLRSGKGQPEEGASRLVELHTLVLKAIPYSKFLVNKMILVGQARSNISAAHQIVHNPNCTPEALAILKKGFPPLRHEDTTTRWCHTNMYLNNKEAFQVKITNARYFEFLHPILWWRNWGSSSSGGRFFSAKPSSGPPPSTPPKYESGFWERNVSRIVAGAFFKRNRSIRDLKRYYDLLIAQSDLRPPSSTAALTFGNDYGQRPRLSNICGWLLVREHTEISFEKATASATKALVLSDLLAIELRTMCGEKTDIRDYYTGENYITNPKFGFYKSAGPDGVNGTSDDVTLGQDRY
ncbi:MAG: hypothetical protein C0404_12740 [Verrucomicrobia bacterium]|nr:hypothetical protein [Verrucomicrobiota bacterium]